MAAMKIGSAKASYDQHQMETKSVVPVYLPASVLERFQAVAKQRGQSLGYVIGLYATVGSRDVERGLED